MKFPHEFLDRLRDTLAPSSVIGKTVKLQMRGSNHVGLCPFHKEKTPSFTVSDEKGFYHCFGCSAHGDIIKFTMETKHLQFSDAVKLLAEEAGLSLPKITPAQEREEHKAKSLYEVMEMACVWFEKNLRTQQGRSAREYLGKRGLSEEAINTFRLGYAPDSYSALKAYMKTGGVDDLLLKSTGLVTDKDNDRFRNRVIFPIQDGRGKVIAFGGRVLEKEALPKYLNSPETELFKKNNSLYALDLAKSEIIKTGAVVAVEGYMDVIAMHKAGITNTVAPLGTALTENQLRIMWRFTKEPIICLDGDQAGRKAMVRIAENFISILQPGYSIKFALLPKGQDPDDILKNHGVDYLKNILKNATSLSETIWNIESNTSLHTPEERAGLERRLNLIADSIQDRSVQNFYRQFFRNKLWENFRNTQKKSKKIGDSQIKNSTVTPNKLSNKNIPEISRIMGMTQNPAQICEQDLLSYIIDYPELLQDHDIEEEFSRIEFSSPNLDKLQSFILESFALNSGLRKNDLAVALENKGINHQILPGEQYIRRANLTHCTKEIARIGWQYYISLYNFTNTKLLFQSDIDAVEFSDAEDVNENLDEKLQEINRQLLLLKQSCEEAKTSYEDALAEAKEVV